MPVGTHRENDHLTNGSHRAFVRNVLSSHPIIAAVRDERHVSFAAASCTEVVFLMCGSIFDLPDSIEQVHRAGKAVFVHLDLIKGIASDREGVEYMAERLRPDGVVSTKTHSLQSARRAGLATIQQLFIIDGHAYDTGLKNVRSFGPDAVEVMPGLMPRVISDLSKEISCPIIAAGLIRRFREVERILEAGAVAAAVGDSRLWSQSV